MKREQYLIPELEVEALVCEQGFAVSYWDGTGIDVEDGGEGGEDWI